MTTLRKNPLVKGKIYHIFNRSIAKFVIFNDEKEFARMLETVKYYQSKDCGDSLSHFIKMKESEAVNRQNKIKIKLLSDKLVDIIAFCLMPTHVHFVLKQLKDGGISIFMSNIQNSYTRFFNLRHQRKGPLWEGRFKSVLVEDDEQLLHLTRYVHLNPVTAGLVEKPKDWFASSYKQYLKQGVADFSMCNFSDILDIDSGSYQEFVNDQISYQRDLAGIKHLVFD
ncbi:MAG: transposase [Candidatus Omnitrophica bacterium]|nr:transposase [Candidatus Omnitrophota bacterium]